MLITGASGLLGNNLAYFFKEGYDILGLYNAHPVTIEGVRLQKLNLLSQASVEKIIDDFSPDIIIHCAAIADVELCETEKPLADEINVLATKILVDAIDRIKKSLKLIHISTDLVYDGSKGDYREEDPLKPLNYYGLTKQKAEWEALRIKNALVVRTSFFGWNIID